MALVEAPPRTSRHPLHVLAVLAVLVANVGCGALALVTFHQERSLSVGDIRLSTGAR